MKQSAVAGEVDCVCDDGVRITLKIEKYSWCGVAEALIDARALVEQGNETADQASCIWYLPYVQLELTAS